MEPYISSPYFSYHNYNNGYPPLGATMPTAESPYNGSYEAITNQRNQPILTNNPAVTAITLFKELSGFPNYGNPSGNADILYTGNRGEWTFELSPFLFAPGNLRAQLFIRAVLDDHLNVPVNRYSATISINGDVVHRGPLPLQHGIPVGGLFINWGTLVFNVRDIRRVNRIVITNTSNTGDDDWIGLDWMEMRFFPR